MADIQHISSVASRLSSARRSGPRIVRREPELSEEEFFARQAEYEKLREEWQREYYRTHPTADSGDPDCPICEGLGYVRYEVPEDHPHFGRIFACECRGEQLMARLEQISGLLPHQREKRFDRLVGPELERIAGMAEAFTLSGRGWFTVYGGSGNAKSDILMASVNLFRERFRQVATYVRFADLVDWVREGFNEDAPDERAAARLGQLKNVGLLAIDELDKINETKWAAELRFRLLDDRYSLGLEPTMRFLTLFATNASPEALPEWLRSRMRDGRFICVENAQGDARPDMRWEEEDAEVP
jgi:DNA replication protein DnaC